MFDWYDCESYETFNSMNFDDDYEENGKEDPLPKKKIVKPADAKTDRHKTKNLFKNLKDPSGFDDLETFERFGK